MYVGSHYNSYYNNLFGDRGSVYGLTRATGSTNVASLLGKGLYNQQMFGSGAVQYVQNLKTGSAGLQAALRDLSSGAAFRQTAAVSSNPEALSLEGALNKYAGTMAETTVQVEQIATGQRNQGQAMQAKGQSGLLGYQQFAVEINGKTQQLSFEALSTDSNRDVQQKMADAINQKNLGLTAKVTMDGANSYLSIQSDATGVDAKNQFSLRDVSGSAVAQMGVAAVTQEAQDALYSINGGASRSSQTNTVDLGNGLKATLKKASDEPVTISMGIDQKQAAAKVQSLVDSYNQLYGAVLGSDDSKSNALFTRITGISRTYASALAQVGIGFDGSGYMTVDTDKLNAAAEDGSLQRFFTENSNTNYGFTNQLARVAGDVNSNTARYVSDSSFSGSSVSSTAQNSFFSSLQFYNMQSQLNNMSLLFDIKW